MDMKLDAMKHHYERVMCMQEGPYLETREKGNAIIVFGSAFHSA